MSESTTPGSAFDYTQGVDYPVRVEVPMPRDLFDRLTDHDHAPICRYDEATGRAEFLAELVRQGHQDRLVIAQDMPARPGTVAERESRRRIRRWPAGHLPARADLGVECRLAASSSLKVWPRICARMGPILSRIGPGASGCDANRLRFFRNSGIGCLYALRFPMWAPSKWTRPTASTWSRDEPGN